MLDGGLDIYQSDPKSVLVGEYVTDTYGSVMLSSRPTDTVFDIRVLWS